MSAVDVAPDAIGARTRATTSGAGDAPRAGRAATLARGYSAATLEGSIFTPGPMVEDSDTLRM
ncbi:MAG: hypothetical protein RL283_1601 [Actinomycetota bacterium]|jgi:hypothetical protein